MTHSDKRSYFFKIDTTIKRIRSFMQKGLNEAGIDLTVDQWVVIDHIKAVAGITQNDLAASTAKDAPTITRILDLLVQKKLIERKMSKHDRRKFNVFLTPKGNETYEEAFKIIGEARRKSWGSLNDNDYSELVRIMDTIYENIT